MCWCVESGPTSSMAVGSAPWSHSGDGSLWPSGWHGHVHSDLLVWHTETSVGTGTHGEGHWVPNTTILEDRHQHPTAFQPVLQKYSVFLPASWQQLFLWFYSHIKGYSTHGSWNNNNKHHRHCHYIPICLNTGFTMSKPLNYAVSTKSRKTMRHQLSKSHIF